MTPFTVSVHNGSVAHFMHTANVSGADYDNITITFAFNKQTVSGKTLSSLPLQVIVRALKNCKFLVPGCRGLPNRSGATEFTGVSHIGKNSPPANLASVLLRSGVELTTGDHADANVWVDVVFSGYRNTGPAITLAEVFANLQVPANEQFNTRGTPLIYASALGNPTFVSAILRAGANINQTLTRPAQPYLESNRAQLQPGTTALDAANGTGESAEERYKGANLPATRTLLKTNGARCNLNCRSGDTNLQGVVQQ